MYQAKSMCMTKAKYSLVEPLKYHRYKFINHSKPMVFHLYMKIHLTEVHVNFCGVGRN